MPACEAPGPRGAPSTRRWSDGRGAAVAFEGDGVKEAMSRPQNGSHVGRKRTREARAPRTHLHLFRAEQCWQQHVSGTVSFVPRHTGAHDAGGSTAVTPSGVTQGGE